MTDRGENPETAPIARAISRSRSRWRALAFIAVALVLVTLTLRVVGDQAQNSGGDRIARVAIEGPITTNSLRLRILEDIAENDQVKAVIVRINSPGGSTAGGEELYESLRLIAAEKPVVAVINELGASAAYMTAIGTDRIFARRLSLVGSVGVLYQHFNAAGLLETIGVDIDKVASGELKAEPDFDEPLTGEVRASFQALVDDSFVWFLETVNERRGLADENLDLIADGRIVNGRVALEMNLIDEIGGEREAIAWLEANDMAEDLPVSNFWPPAKTELERLMDLLGAEARAAVGLDEERLASLDGLVSLWQAGQ